MENQYVRIFYSFMTIPTTELGCPQTRFPRKFTKIRGGKKKNKKKNHFIQKTGCCEDSSESECKKNRFSPITFRAPYFTEAFIIFAFLATQCFAFVFYNVGISPLG